MNEEIAQRNKQSSPPSVLEEPNALEKEGRDNVAHAEHTNAGDDLDEEKIYHCHTPNCAYAGNNLRYL